ncbi:hydroxyacid dehydrogenase [Candidatus Poribacteria bacterium]|nr:hydroxyacid dehydrogenase [Candidatus Poribacteria bacterium]
MSKPKILYLPTPGHTQQVFKPEVFERFLRNFDVTLNETGANYNTEQVTAQIQGFDGLVTGWGTPRLTVEVFENADKLRIMAHSAGSVKSMLADVVENYLIPRNVCVFSANGAIAYNVAEHTIGALIMTSRRFVDHAMVIREKGVWKDRDIPGHGQFLRGSIVGIVSASKVGREVIKLLQPFDVKILIYDPYLSDWEAGRLNVEKVELDDVFARSDFVTIHAPNIPETWGMVGEKQLKLLKNGAVLINTSRGKVIDHQALFAEAKTGRILVTLDVTDPEPLPADSPLRKLSNVYITPHISGAGYYGYFKIGSTTVEALENFFAGKPVPGAVDLSKFAQLA